MPPSAPLPVPARARALLVAVAAVIASGVVPALAITAYAFSARDPAAIAAFAARVAEPLSLAAAGAVIAAAPSRSGRRAGAAVGALAALLLAAVAWWAGDVDRWTLAAALLLPAIGALRARDGGVARLPHDASGSAAATRAAGAPPAIPGGADAPVAPPAVLDATPARR